MKRPGLRLFFMVPPAWTEHLLPLKLSRSADIRRALIGRIELVAPSQRALLRRIAAGPASSPDQWFETEFKKAAGGRDDYFRALWYPQVFDGTRTLASLGITPPADYRAFLELGRFRMALLLDEQSHHPTPAMAQFIRNYGLRGWEPPRK